MFCVCFCVVVSHTKTEGKQAISCALHVFACFRVFLSVWFVSVREKERERTCIPHSVREIQHHRIKFIIR